MTERRLPDPYLLTDADQISRYLTDLVRALQLSLNNIEQLQGEFQQIENLDSVEVSSGGNINRSTAVILCDASASALTMTLPDPLDAKGEVYYVKKINTNANDVTIDVTGGGTIDEQSSIVLTGNQMPCAKVYSDGSEYWII